MSFHGNNLQIFILLMLALLPVLATAATGDRQRVILETDLCNDVDDVGVLAMLHAMHDNGEIDLLAVSYNEAHAFGTRAVDAINTWYGRGELPIGIYKGTLEAPDGSSYVQGVSWFPNDLDPAAVPDSLDLYRQVLSAQPDGSVVIISVGFTQNLLPLRLADRQRRLHDHRAVVAQDYTNTWAKAGVMIRASTANDAAHAMVVMTPAIVDFQQRTSASGDSSRIPGDGQPTPHWVRTVRNGNLVAGYHSADGSTWTKLGEVTVALGDTALVGLAVTSHAAGTLSSVTFTDVVVDSASTPGDGGGRGSPRDILFNPATGTYATWTTWNEYGVGYQQNLRVVAEPDAFTWQASWPTAKNINRITIGGKVQGRLGSTWTTIAAGTGGWIGNGIFAWGGSDQAPIVADAIRVLAYSDGTHDLVSIHLRGRGGLSGGIDDRAEPTKATLIQFLPSSGTPAPTLDVTSVVLRGVVVGGTLTVDGQAVEPATDGTWEAAVEMPGEAHRTVEIVAEGSAGRAIRHVGVDEAAVPTTLE